MRILLCKDVSTLTRIFDLAQLAARRASDRALPVGFLRWIRLTRPWAASRASLVLDRNTSDAVLFVLTTSRSCNPSWRTQHGGLQRRLTHCLGSHGSLKNQQLGPVPPADRHWPRAGSNDPINRTTPPAL